MKVLIFEASGMVGRGVLLECFHDPQVELVVALGRTGVGIAEGKLREIVHPDLLNYSGIEDSLLGFDACLYRLGVGSAGMKQARLRSLHLRLTPSRPQTSSAVSIPA